MASSLFLHFINDSNIGADLRRIMAQPERVCYGRMDQIRKSQMHLKHYRLHMAHDEFRVLGCACRGCVLALAKIQRRKAA